MGYPDVYVYDSTNFNVNGTVEYASLFCKNDDYSATPQTPWSNSRGICLITKISAVVTTPQGNIEATPYESSGTSYSQFAVIQVGPSAFEVTRRVTGAEDARPRDHVEPTEPQK